ncbi:MAG TPA: DUF4097 family beta strand repeat-containing protein, partial [Bryobacteraceae bacterium]|nr:DUF4097 family beta strand repeat-containing protein [Bryobacteraceae bacterium]
MREREAFANRILSCEEDLMVRVVMAAASAFLLSGCFVADFGSSDRYQTDFHYTWDLQPTARVEAESFDGAIEVEGWDENRVEITGVKYGSTESLRDAVKIDVRHSPDSVQIRAVKPSIHAGGAGARFTIHVPRQAIVDRVTTSNGSIRVHDVARAAHLKSSNGSIKVENVNGDLDAHTSNSSIDADGVRGSVALRTSNGRIHAENIDGQCEAQTTNSSIAVRMDSAVTSPLKLTTSNGSIDLTLTKPPKSDV